MQMLEWMRGHTMKDKIRNECKRKHLGVATIADKMKENSLKWFGLAQ